MPHHVRRFLALSATDRWQFLRAYCWLIAIDVALRVAGFQRLTARPADATTHLRPATAADVQNARRAAYWLELASRHHVVRARCLHRALVLDRWLRAARLPSDLRIGVRKDDGALKAHAWVELAGQVVTDPPEAVVAFTPLLRKAELAAVRASRIDAASGL